MEQITYEYLKENGLILFETIVGSQAYGTNVATSDIDKKFIFILPMDYILGTGYIEQLNVDKDYTGYEIRRFLELLGTANPTVLELLNSPEDCIIYKHSLFDNILANKDKFITKECKNSFAGYGKQQISKARGLNKKQNWEKDKVTRKDVLDFCTVINGHKSHSLKRWLEEQGFDQKFCGITNIPNARDMFALFYDFGADMCFNESRPEDERQISIAIHKERGWPMGFGYKGITKIDENGESESNTLRLSSIPKDEIALITFSFNKDGYTSHCKDFKEYQEWLEKRNVSRYVDNQAHGQTYDSKNMMHCIRLVRMANEIAAGKGINIRRADREELLAIRRGEVDLGALIEEANKSIEEMDILFDKSNLPDKVEHGLVNNLLIKIRKEFYGK